MKRVFVNNSNTAGYVTHATGTVMLRHGQRIEVEGEVKTTSNLSELKVSTEKPKTPKSRSVNKKRSSG